jgi:glycyl-tRNA synthetase
VMGKYYAMDSGEPPAVAQAIEEHYKPRGADASLPESKPGIALAIADRLDSLAGLFAAGLAPTGARDPFALRRAAIGVIQILIERSLFFDLREGVRAAAALQPLPVSDAVKTQLLEFIAGRLRGVLAERGFRYDVVEAVLGARSHDPAAAHLAAQELTHWSARPEWATVLAAYARCVRITREYATPFPVDANLLREDAERSLFDSAASLESNIRQLRERGVLTVNGFFAAFAPHVANIAAFFDAVLVMADDEAVRNNRLGLLQRIVHLADGVVDLSKMEGF